MTKLKSQLFIAGCLLFFAGQGIAKEKLKPVAEEFFDGTTLAFEHKGNFRNATISVTGPEGYAFSNFQKIGSPTVNLSTSGTLADGEYNYEISVATDKKISRKNKLNNGRGPNARAMVNVGETQSGSFRVKDGVIVNNANISESQGGSVK